MTKDTEQAPFEFNNKFSVYNDELDLTSFNLEVPKPGAQVDLQVALKEYRRDVENVQFIYSNNVEISIEAMALFWSERHPHEGERARADRELQYLNRSLRRVAEKARKCL